MSSPAALMHWAILDLQQIITDTGIKIVVTTNNPCHLWLLWTHTKPKKHIILIKDRGIYIDAAFYQCFIKKGGNEQMEPGDTLVHSFLKEPWKNCETRYIYFIGQVNYQDSPSESPIFKKHRSALWGWNLTELWQYETEPPPMWCHTWELWTYHLVLPPMNMLISEQWG